MNQDLTDIILEGAVLVRQGAFSLAVEKAQEKLKKFQLPDPRYYITQMMQALLASGARNIEVTLDGLQVKIRFDGPGYTRSELDQISDAVFESGKNRSRDRLRELALGLLSVQGLRPREVSICSQGFRWQNQGVRGTVSPCESDLQQVVIIHRRSGTNEMQILRQACQSCRAAIYVNEAVLCGYEGAAVSSCPWPNFAFRGPNFRGAFGIAYGDIPATSLSLTRYGVVFSKRSEPRILPSLIVEMEHDLLRKNASQSDVVEDEHYSTMLADLQKVQLEFAVQLATQRIPSYQSAQVYSYFLEIVLQNLSRELLALPAEELDSLENQLADAPLLPGGDGRRCSPRQVWHSIEEYGTALFGDEGRSVISCQPGTVLRLSEASATSLRSLFPEIRRLRSLTTEECKAALLSAKQERTHALPPVLARGTDSTGAKVVLLDRPPGQAISQYVTADNDRLELQPSMHDSPLSFDLVTSRPLWLNQQTRDRMLTETVEPLYLQLAHQLSEGLQVTRRAGLQRAVFHYLKYKFGSLSQALRHPDWRSKGLFFTSQQGRVSLDDLRAWLAVYPSVVGTYGLTVGSEDHSLFLTPESLRTLRQLLGDDQVRLATLSQPLLVERGQQMGLSGAATAGVKKEVQTDVDEELAAIRRELDEAQEVDLSAIEDRPLNSEAVLQHLGLQPKAVDLAEVQQEQKLPEFCTDCLKATRQLGTRWLQAFRQPGLQGQIWVHDGTLPRPLRPDHLLVKVAGNEPAAYPTKFLGLGGWLYVPANWQPDPEFLWPTFRCDWEVPECEQQWASPQFPFDLGSPALETDLLWAIRRLYKLGAQHCADGRNDAGVGSIWNRRLSLFLLWDRVWALDSHESWFARVPLWRNLAGRILDLQGLRKIEGPLWAPPGPGLADWPERTIRLMPPFQLQDLESLVGIPWEKASLRQEEKREQQLLGEVKQALVITCQKSQTPLEPSWVEGLKFGPPTRWIGGPRKYFIEHEALEAVTRLNPADALLLRLFRDQSGWEHQIPVLASAVYTAINRALAEVEDEHELSYLEAMLSQLP